jgi:formate hydrogenlyase transcriptional activator
VKLVSSEPSRKPADKATTPSTDNTVALFPDLLEYSQDLICAHNLGGEFLYVSPAAARALGYGVEELLRIPMHDLIAPEYHDQFHEYLVRIQRDGVARGQLALLTKSGELRVWEYHNLLHTDDQSSTSVHGVARDVTEQTLAKSALREALQLNRQIIDRVGQGLVLIDRDLHCVVWNRFMEELTMLPSVRVLHRPLPEVLPQFAEERVRSLLALALAGKSASTPDIPLLLSKGRLKWVAGNLSPLMDASGEVTGVIVALHEVTERKKSEEALRQSEAHFRVALRSSRVVVFNQDRDLRYTWMHNPQIGPSAESFIGKTLEDIVPGIDAADISAVKRGVIETGQGDRQQVALTIAGKRSFYDLSVEPLVDADGKVEGITCAAADVTELRARSDMLEMLLQINRALASKRTLPELLATIASCIHPVLHHDVIGVALYDSMTHAMRIDTLDASSKDNPFAWNDTLPLNECLSAKTFLSGKVEFLGHADLVARGSDRARRARQSGIKSLVFIPLKNRKGTFGVLSLASRQVDGFRGVQIELLEQIAAVFAAALDNARAYNEIAELKDKLYQEKIYLEDELRTELHFEEMVGESPALVKVLTNVRTVAATDATVLVLGETGTGKELIARSIHRLSTRSQRPFIKLNCAAFPAGLLEAELFGHERGAFTGAVNQKFGRLELADQGTLFLDEVGELPLELQPKLLRVLQDQEFERLGSNRTRHLNVRLIAATNRDLAKCMNEKTFRSDLYYRLNVFPLRVPSLRERTDDIPLLVRYFVQRYAGKMNKPISSIPQAAMNAIQSWNWPGNIRELENFIQRSVICTRGSVLRVSMAELDSDDKSPGPDNLEATEREHITRILSESRWNISRAATRLGVKRTTLQSMISRLGISLPNAPAAGQREFPRL